MSYRLIIVENSIKDWDILSPIEIISITQFERGTSMESRMIKLSIPEAEVQRVSELVSENLTKSYYAHMYPEDANNTRLVVIFSGKIFDVKQDNYSEALDYGVRNGVTRVQMNISPKNISEELW